MSKKDKAEAQKSSTMDKAASQKGSPPSKKEFKNQKKPVKKPVKKVAADLNEFSQLKLIVIFWVMFLKSLYPF